MRTLAFPTVILLTLLVSLLPAPWRVEWSRDLAAIVRFPLRPFSHAGNAFAGWLRPLASPAQGMPVEAKALLEQALEDRDVAQRLFHKERRRVLELTEQVVQLQQIDSRTRQYAEKILRAQVSQRSSSAPDGVLEVSMPRGVDDPVPPGTVGICRGVYLLGRTVNEEVAVGRVKFLPVVAEASGPLRTRVWPSEEPEMAFDRAERLHLEPSGGRVFRGDVDRTAAIQEGDVVRLDDSAWPESAQMLVVGVVATVEPNDYKPLRNTVVVKPVYGVTEISELSLVVDSEGGVDHP